MTPPVSAFVGGGIAAVYVPILRNQIRDGEVGIPLGTINPFRIRRDENPRLFRLAAIALCILVGLIIAACIPVLFRNVVA